MSMLKAVTLAAALIAGTTSLTTAQNGPGGGNGNNGMPPGSYLGPGAYPSYKSSDYRLQQNATNTMPPSGYQGPGSYPSYKSSDYQQGSTAANAAASGGRPLYSYYSGPGPAAGGAAWCQVHYRSYNPATGMFRGFNGIMHPCP